MHALLEKASVVRDAGSIIITIAKVARRIVTTTEEVARPFLERRRRSIVVALFSNVVAYVEIVIQYTVKVCIRPKRGPKSELRCVLVLLLLTEWCNNENGYRRVSF